MKVAIVGGTGFVGSYVVDELVNQGHHPVLLVRPGSESWVSQRKFCTLVSGDVQDPEAVRKTLEGCDATIYLIGILREDPGKGITFEQLQYWGAKRTIDLSIEAGVSRFLLMSANGVKPEGTPYQSTKYQAEEHLMDTGLNWTIFRPSVIFGPPRGRMEFCTQLYEQIIKPPFPAPLFYDGLLPFDAGTFRLAPIHVKDVATCFVKSLAMSETYQKTYGLCGPDALEWRVILRLLSDVVGKAKVAVPVPALGVKMAAFVLEGLPFFPITRDQISMLMEGNTCDSSEVFALFDITPTRFDEESLAYLRS
jgi:NADH dehydrogenase